MWHRKPIVAGSFYPDNPAQLENMIDQYLENAVISDFSENVIGVISPHAGYIYSGPVAGFSYKYINPLTEIAVVLAPSHRARFNGASVIPSGVYETPLGSVDIDSAVGNALSNENYYAFIKEAHQFEHSLEVQVPFLQKVLKNFKIVPIIVGTTDLDICTELANSLANVLKNDKRKYSIIISTDLSHYHSYDTACTIDNEFIHALKSFDAASVKSVLSSKKAEACGEGPIITGILACRILGAQHIEILKYANSGDTGGDKSQVVGYLSAAIVM